MKVGPALWPLVAFAAGCMAPDGMPAGPRDLPDGSTDVPREITALPTGIECEPWLLSGYPSGLMIPGADCLSCHERTRGAAPGLTVAGTVFRAVDEAEGCQGVEDIEVVVLDAAGIEHVLISNLAGNFYTSDPVELPAHAYLRRGRLTRHMRRSIDTGACNSCHTAEGEESAPGRIVSP